MRDLAEGGASVLIGGGLVVGLAWLSGIRFSSVATVLLTIFLVAGALLFVNAFFPSGGGRRY